jgi:two-component system, chemotaxis family, response regulator Rcp1
MSRPMFVRVEYGREARCFVPGLLRILLIEDNPSDVRLFQEALKENGLPYDLRVFDECNEALEFAFGEGHWEGADHPHIIILDLNLPGTDGAETLRRLKTDERTRATPVIMFSSSASPADIHRCYDLRANCYVQKPLDLDTTFHVIRSLETFWGSVAKLPNL